MTAIEVLQRTKATDELSVFARDYLSGGDRLPFRPPVDAGIQTVEGVHGLVIWREGRFQVQLFICAPNVVIPCHSHPNVDSYEVVTDGLVDFVIDGERVVHTEGLKRRKGDHSAWFGIAARVRPGAKHGGFVGPNGGSFMSIQHWPEGIPMSSVGHDWVGETMGPRHDAEVGKAEV